MNHKVITVILLPLLLLVGCREDISISKEVVLIDPGTLESTTITGRVEDPNENPISYATVTYDDQTVTTDENGFFVIPDVSVRSGGVAVHAEKYSYISQTTRSLPINGSNTFLVLTLPWDFGFDSISGDVGGTVTDSLESVTVTFGANTLVDDQGQIYTGNIRSTIVWHDPDQQSKVGEWPGNLNSITSEGEMQILGNTGMVQMDISTMDCRPLRLALEATALVTINRAMQTAEITEDTRVFSFDKEFGLWLETPTTINESILQDVTRHHFEINRLGAWSYGETLPTRTISGSVLDLEGRPAANQLLRYTYRDQTEFAGTLGYTNAQGRYRGTVPVDRELDLTIADPFCNTRASVGMIGPFSTNAEAEELQYETPSTTTTISGIAYDCVDDAAAGAVVYLMGSGSVLASSIVEVSGAFSVTTICPSDLVRIMIYDPLTDLSASSELLEGLVGDQEIGELIVCNQVGSFVTVTSQIGNTNFEEPQILVDDNTGNYTISAQNGQASLRVVFLSPDQSDPDPVEVTYSTSISTSSCLSPSMDCNAVISTQLSEYTADMIAGKISGELYINPDDLSETRKIEIIFKVRR